MLDYWRLAFSCFFTLNLNTMIVEVYHLCKTNSESLISTSSDARSATTS